MSNSGFYYCVVLLICAIMEASSQVEKAVLPKDESALSLWLISRTGWVYCERAAEYMNGVGQRFDEVKCKKCYLNLFNKHKRQPSNVTDAEIVKCSRNFGASIIPSMPSFTESNGESRQQPSFGLLRQLNPFETVGVRAFTCNSEVSQNPTLSMERILVPTAASVFQLFSTREFSSNNGPKLKYPRKSYVDCLFGKLFETELALCPINTARRRCALEGRQLDEEIIFSTNIPISYD